MGFLGAGIVIETQAVHSLLNINGDWHEFEYKQRKKQQKQKQDQNRAAAHNGQPEKGAKPEPRPPSAKPTPAERTLSSWRAFPLDAISEIPKW